MTSFQEKWAKDQIKTRDYYETLICAFDHHLAVAILRLQDGLDVSDFVKDPNQDNPGPAPPEILIDTCFEEDSEGEARDGLDNEAFDYLNEDSTVVDMNRDDQDHRRRNSENLLGTVFWSKKSGTTGRSLNFITDEMALKARQFRTKTSLKGTIDIYWLFDDGGLTLLLPHILTTRRLYSKCKMRIFFLSNAKIGSSSSREARDELIEQEIGRMAELLTKFRIDYEDIILITDVNKIPAKPTRRDFLKMLKARRFLQEEHI